MSDAVALTSLSGFDNLGESAYAASIAYHLGLPKIAALRGRSSEQIQSAHSSAVAERGRDGRDFWDERAYRPQWPERDAVNLPAE